MGVPLQPYWSLLKKYLTRQWPRMSLLAILLLGYIGLQLVNPQLLRFFIDTAMTGGSTTQLTRAALLFIGIALGIQAIAVINAYLSDTIAWTATNALRRDLTEHCLKLDLSFFQAHTPGELIERIDGDVNALANFFSQFLIQMVGNAVLIIGVLVLLFAEDWRAGLGLFIFTAIGLMGLIHIRTIAIPYWTGVRQMSGDFYGYLGEVFAATEDIQANGARSYVMRRFFEHIRQWFPIQRNAHLAGGAMWMTNVGLVALGNALAFGVSAYLWRVESITIGAVYLIFHYTQLIYGPLAEIRSQIEDLQQAEASIARIQALLAIQSKLKDGTEATLPAHALSVALQDVSFSYNGQETVLHRLNFRLQSGKVLGVLGRTGSGKTTLARLLLRLYDPTNGEIRLGNVTPDAVPLSDVRHRVGLVTQDVQLFQGTVRDNLTFFNPIISDAQMLAVLDELGLSDWRNSLQHGLDTRLGSEGVGLSAGQAQLLTFARVFLANPGLVILDEASSRLDPATERLIERAIDKLLEARTGIIIAHRLETIQRTDEILILEDGQIAEYGNRLMLANNPNSRFSQLLRTGLAV